MRRPRDTLLNHDSAAEAAAEADARGEPLDEVDQLVAEAVRLAKAGEDNEPAAPAVEALVADTLQLAQGQEGGAGEAGAASGRWLAYGMCTLVTWNLFSNHWNRDSIGALELRLEAPDPKPTPNPDPHPDPNSNPHLTLALTNPDPHLNPRRRRRLR